MSHIARSNKPRYEQRQAEAQVRKDLAAQRSPQAQLARLDAARLVAAKERAKLQARLGPTASAAAPSSNAPAAPARAPKGKKARKAAQAAGNA